MRQVEVVFQDSAGETFEYKTEFKPDFTNYDIEYMFTDGNYGCDCNKSLFIIRSNPDYPEHGCGETIKITSLKVDGESINCL